jgi:hypothetical protein
VVRRVVQVPLRGMRVMRRRQVIAGLVVFSGFAMVSSRVVVVFRRLAMMFRRLLGHTTSFHSVFELRGVTVTGLCE